MKVNTEVLQSSMNKTPEKEREEKEFQDFIKEFDFFLLERLLEANTKRMGLDRPLGIYGPEKIFLTEDPAIFGAHYVLKGKIELNVNLLLKKYPDAEKRKSSLTQTLIHEELHAATTEGRKTGFTPDMYRIYPAFSLWNEGVTEKMAIEVTREYLDSMGMSGQEVSHHDSYNIDREFVDLFITKISQSTGFEEKVVWQAIQRAYFVEGTITSEDLEGVFPPGFFDFLEYASQEDLAKGPDHMAMRAQVHKNIRKEMAKPRFLQLLGDVAVLLGRQLFPRRAA